MCAVRAAGDGGGTAVAVNSQAIGVTEASSTLAVARPRNVSAPTCANLSVKPTARAATHANSIVNVDVRSRTSGSFKATYEARRGPCHQPSTVP